MIPSRSARLSVRARQMLVALATCAVVLGVLTAAPGPAEALQSGVQPSSTSWTSPSTGWVLGWTPCRSGLCPALLETSDGGATWSKRATPDIQPSDVGFQTRVFFAEWHDHSIGLITNSRDLFVTYDGAQTWQPLQLPHAEVIGGIGAGARSVYVVAHEQDGSQVSTQAFTSPIQGPRWRAVPGVAATSPGGIYSTMSVVSGSGRAVQISTATNGGVVELWTALNGHRFQSAYPCNPRSVLYPGMGTDDRQFVLCSYDPGHGDMYKELRTGSAADRFATVVGTPPPYGITSDFAVGDDLHIAVGATKDSFALVHESFDGGQTWETTLAVPNTGPVRDLSFQDAQHGVLVAGTAEIGSSILYRTTDGGHTWTPLDL